MKRKLGRLLPSYRSMFGAICALLLGLNIWGAIFPPDFRSEFSEPIIGYEAALDRIDSAWTAYGASRSFLKKAVRTYAAATAYKWPEGMARVRFTDNWILALAAYADPVIEAIGLKNDSDLFSQFESYRYERALGRGFGICSQNALGFADLLNRRYDIDIRLVGLNGHVVTQAETPDGDMILDPSIGIALPMSLTDAESKPDLMRAVYAKTEDPGIANAYNASGNFVSALPGAHGYSKAQYRNQEIVRRCEITSDYLKWILPLLMLAFLIRLQPR